MKLLQDRVGRVERVTRLAAIKFRITARSLEVTFVAGLCPLRQPIVLRQRVVTEGTVFPIRISIRIESASTCRKTGRIATIKAKRLCRGRLLDPEWYASWYLGVLSRTRGGSPQGRFHTLKIVIVHTMLSNLNCSQNGLRTTLKIILVDIIDPVDSIHRPIHSRRFNQIDNLGICNAIQSGVLKGTRVANLDLLLQILATTNGDLSTFKCA